MPGTPAMIWPEAAYVPGRTERPPDGLYDPLRDTVAAGMSIAQLLDSPAYRAGLAYFDAGFFWEAHEVLEPVWMAAPDPSGMRDLVRALIQLANAGLKRRMERPRAVARLCAQVRDLSAGAPARDAALAAELDWLRPRSRRSKKVSLILTIDGAPCGVVH